MTNKKKTLGLLNYEGDVLKVYRADLNEYAIYDQWNELVEVFTLSEFIEFLDGRRRIVDSRENSWEWPSSHVDARTSLRKIFEFINENANMPE